MAKHVLAALVVLVALEGAPTTADAQAQPGINELLARVGERIADFSATRWEAAHRMAEWPAR